MKKNNTFRWVGIALLVVGFLMALGLFPIFYCFGISTFLGCAGVNINLGFWFGIAFGVVGLILVLRAR